jgi:hypothetical protein
MSHSVINNVTMSFIFFTNLNCLRQIVFRSIPKKKFSKRLKRSVFYDDFVDFGPDPNPFLECGADPDPATQIV